MFGTIITTFLVIALLAWLTTCIVITKQKTIKVLETFGKYSGQRHAGISFKLPAPFQVVANIVPMNIQQLSTNLELKTADNLFIKYPVTIQIQVVDAEKATYELEHPDAQILSYISNLVRSEVGKRTFLELYGIRDELQQEIESVLAQKINDFGYKIIAVLVNEPIPTEEVQQSYNSVTASEREREAAKNKAEAIRITIVAEAEAQKESKKLQGEGIAAQREAIAKGFKEATETIAQSLGISNEMAVLMILQLNKFDTLRDASANKGTVIITDGGSDSEITAMQKMLASMSAINGKMNP